MGSNDMEQEWSDKIMTKEELEEHIKDAITPIDFEALIQAGVLEKRGSWYKICKKDELPSHANCKIKKLKIKNGEALVLFSPISKRLEKLYRRRHP